MLRLSQRCRKGLISILLGCGAVSLAIDARRFDKAQSSHLQVSNVHVVKLWHCKPQFTSRTRIFATYFASAKIGIPKISYCTWLQQNAGFAIVTTRGTRWVQQLPSAIMRGRQLDRQPYHFKSPVLIKRLSQLICRKRWCHLDRRCNSRRQLRRLSGCRRSDNALRRNCIEFGTVG